MDHGVPLECTKTIKTPPHGSIENLLFDTHKVIHDGRKLVMTASVDNYCYGKKKKEIADKQLFTIKLEANSKCLLIDVV